MATDLFHVTATSLNLRSEPKVRPTNRLASLPHGQEVRKLAESSDPEWWRISTTLSGQTVEGFVSKSFLEPEEAAPVPPAHSGVIAVHLEENRANVTRNTSSGRAFPIGESDRPNRDLASPSLYVSQLLGIIDYLKVDTSERYRRTSSSTYCNIYAYDYCYLAHAYLPRVWWLPTAIERLARGETVPVRYDATVGELNANSLFGWFRDFADRFGWARTFSATELQNAANLGKVCIIVARRTELNQPGHITAVVPENGPNTAARSSGEVTVPLQSQAGASNFRFGTSLGRWWAGAKFREFGFWIHP